jgi:hypothetical protein
VNRPGLVQPVGCRSVMSTGVGIALVAAGAILRFAIPAAFTHGLNLRVVGVIVMLAGVIALLLSLLVWGPLSRPRGDIGQGPRGQGHGPSSLTNPPYATLGPSDYRPRRASVYARLRLRLLRTLAAPDNLGRPGYAP